MTEAGNGSRTHEPSLRELTAELDGLRDLVAEKVLSLASRMDERDRRYEDRFRAMDEKTSLALDSSEKAVMKAETATEKRFDSVNEFRLTLSDQAATLMQRGEAQAKFAALDEKLLSLKDEVTRNLSSGAGKSAGALAMWGYVVGAVGIVATLITIAITAVRILSVAGR